MSQTRVSHVSYAEDDGEGEGKNVGEGKSVGEGEGSQRSRALM